MIVLYDILRCQILNQWFQTFFACNKKQCVVIFFFKLLTWFNLNNCLRPTEVYFMKKQRFEKISKH